MRASLRMFLAVSVVMAVAASAQAHFIWLVPTQSKDGTATVQVYFGEDASPDDPDFLARIKTMKLLRVSGDNTPTPVKLELTDDSLLANVKDDDGRSLFIGSHDLGVFDRGDAVFRLKYYAKGGPAITSRTWERTNCADDLRLDFVPSLDGNKITVAVQFDEKPVAGAQVVASGPGLDDFEGLTDDQGQATFEMAEGGVYSIRARHIEDAAGELDGKSYPQTRHYTTVAVNVPEPLVEVAAKTLADIPQPVTSFGAAIVDGGLYVYGGHTGSAHSYSQEEQSHTLSRLDLQTREWESVAQGPHLQGLALVAHDGKLYRIGGFTAKNAEGEDHDLWSQASVACFDPADKSWAELPPLPEPRSSHDAAVVGDTIYVAGGWSMQGDAENQWHATAWKMDLNQQPLRWEPVPSPPFQRRALSLAAHQGKLYAIGGMQQEGGPTRRVDVFDPATGEWSLAPELVGEDRMTGFGTSAFATGGNLYVTTIKGMLQRLSDDNSAWELVGATPTARFFHRMLPFDDSHLLVVGGANMGIGKFDEVEVLSVTQ